MEKLSNYNQADKNSGKINSERGNMSFQAMKIEKARENTKFWARAYYDTERDFEKRMKRGDIEYEEFLKWEDDAKFNFDKIQEFENEARFSSIYEKDKTENFGILEASLSIEAKSGDFYRRRQRALNEAIEQSDDSNKEKDLGVAQDLYRCVGEHIYYETDYETRSFDPKQYERNRRAAHNRLILQLNCLNALAEKYGVRRFTPRNFETNDFPYDEKLDIGKYTDMRAEYDRASVEFYCRNAFSSQYDKALRDSGLTNL